MRQRPSDGGESRWAWALAGRGFSACDGDRAVPSFRMVSMLPSNALVGARWDPRASCGEHGPSSVLASQGGEAGPGKDPNGSGQRPMTPTLSRRLRVGGVAGTLGRVGCRRRGGVPQGPAGPRRPSPRSRSPAAPPDAPAPFQRPRPRAGALARGAPPPAPGSPPYPARARGLTSCLAAAALLSPRPFPSGQRPRPGPRARQAK